MLKIKIDTTNSYQLFRDRNELIDFVQSGYSEDMAIIMREMQEDANYTLQKIDSDLNAYEGSLDEYNTLCNDIKDSVENLIEHIEESKRINKDMIYKSLLQIIKDINNVQ